MAQAPNAIAVGINCTKPELISALLESAKPVQNFVVYPNSGRQWDAVKKVWLGDQSSAFTDSQIKRWQELGAKVIGGCCEVGPADIKEIGSRLN